MEIKNKQTKILAIRSEHLALIVEILLLKSKIVLFPYFHEF